MKRIIVSLWMVAAILAASLAVTAFSQGQEEQKPAMSAEEETAFSKFRDALQPQNQPKGTTSREEQLQWVRGYHRSAIEAADAFLKAHPNGVKSNEVILDKAYRFFQLAVLDDDAKQRAECRSLANELLKRDPEERIAFTCYTLLLRLAENHTQTAEYVETIAKKFPQNPALADVWFFLANVYQQAGEADKAKQTAEKVVQTFPESRVAEEAKVFLSKLSIIGKPLDLKFTATNGKTVDLKDLRGKVVLLDFWATWCGPCVAELPNMQETYAKYNAKGFEIVGISLDDNREKLDKFIADKKMPWPQYFDGKGWQNAIATQFNIQSIPATFLLDKEGKVVRTDLRGKALPKAVAELLGAQ